MKGVELIEIRLFSDERGMIFEPIDGTELANGKIQNAHIATMAPGVVRGNHYHSEQTEIISVFGSSGEIKFRDSKTGAEETILIETGKVVTFRVSPNIAHAVKNTGKSMMVLVCFADKIHHPERPDREPVILF